MKVSWFQFLFVILAVIVIANPTMFAQAADTADSGITVNAQWTNYYQGLISGTGSKEWDYGGRFDGYASFDTEKLGWWKDGTLSLHAEYHYGNLSSNLGGVLLSSNVGMLLPLSNGLELTNISLIQSLGSRSSLIIGKINLLDLLANDPFFGGAGVSRFLNLAFSAPPSGLAPPVTIGGILSVQSTPQTGWTFMVYDPKDHTEDYWFDDVFEDGVNYSVSMKRSGLVHGRTSSLTITGMYSTADSIDLRDLLLPPDLQTDPKDDSWHASLQLAHFLHESKPGAGDGWGFFFKVWGERRQPQSISGIFCRRFRR